MAPFLRRFLRDRDRVALASFSAAVVAVYDLANSHDGGLVGRRLEVGAAERAGAVGVEPRVDARRVECVAAHRQQPHGIAAAEFRQAHCALYSALPLLHALNRRVRYHRERRKDSRIQPARLRSLITCGSGAWGAEEAATAVQPKGGEVEEIAAEEDGEEGEEYEEKDEDREEHREGAHRCWCDS
uniref:Uncharacterized protein n=1 Tax=Ananas comosus var. bracteatus TaxID=296719 RepID=A0A6V7NEF9_ANACO|nr:unnamed protein product [Ananas comosus var. bracteatus]